MRKTLDNVKLQPANITLTLTAPSLATYKVFGYATITPDYSTVELTNAEGVIVMAIPYSRVQNLIIEF